MRLIAKKELSLSDQARVDAAWDELIRLLLQSIDKESKDAILN